MHSIVTSVRRLLKQPSSKFSKLSIEGVASPEGATPRNAPALEGERISTLGCYAHT